MKKLIYAINMSIDGCCDHTKMTGSDEILEFHTRLMRDVDLIVYGRKTYELMVPYWPEVAKNPSETKAAKEFARMFDVIDKIVFSQSMDSAEGKNTRIIRNNLHDEVLKMKQGQGKSILTGGVSVPSQLIELGLVDEYQIVVHPRIAGEGRRLLEGISLKESSPLKLAGSEVLKSGCVALRYSRQ
jgi:dihydrofolate reductase